MTRLRSPRRMLRRSRPARAWRRLTVLVVRVPAGTPEAPTDLAAVLADRPTLRWPRKSVTYALADGCYSFPKGVTTAPRNTLVQLGAGTTIRGEL